MRVIVISLWACLSLLGTIRDNFALHLKIRELSRELERRDEHMDDFRRRMDACREQLLSSAPDDSLRWEAAYSMFADYAYVNVDSAVFYEKVLERCSSTPVLQNRLKVCRLRVKAITGDDDGLLEGIMACDPLDVDSAFVNRSCIQLQRSGSLIPDGRELLDHIMGHPLTCPFLREDIRYRYMGILARFDGDAATAREFFHKAYDCAQSLHLKALAAYNIATCNTDNDVLYCYWLAQSAIYDIQVPVSEYYSLYNLSKALFDRKHYKLAMQYMRYVVQDAIDGKWASRVMMSAVEEMQFLDVFLRNRRERTLYLIFALFLLGLFVLYIMTTLRRSRKHNRVLKTLMERLHETNARIKDESAIKEKYLFNYMEMAVEGLGRLEEYRLDMRRVLKEEGPDALMAMLRSARSQVDYKEFYKNFDATFLDLYPDFVRKVNALMKEDARFREEAPLSTDLRILATIRLGFRDSGQIARFLNVPPTSVYTRRSAMRRNSVCPKGDFESEIRRLT